MMNDAQQAAFRLQVLSALPGNAALADAYARKNCEDIAAIMSVGRTRHGTTQIGIGTVCVVLGDRGGPFLDAVETLGTTDRNLYWQFDPLRRGVLDLSVPGAVPFLVGLQGKLPDYSADIDKLLLVGVVADPVEVADVHISLFEIDGTPK